MSPPSSLVPTRTHPLPLGNQRLPMRDHRFGEFFRVVAAFHKADDAALGVGVGDLAGEFRELGEVFRF